MLGKVEEVPAEYIMEGLPPETTSPLPIFGWLSVKKVPTTT
jgi:hypothetical protein